jgi:hypothetical protein
MLKNLLSILGFLLAVAAMLWLFFLHLLFAKNPYLIAIQVAAALLMIWARMTFGLRSFHATARESLNNSVDVNSDPFRSLANSRFQKTRTTASPNFTK